MTDDELAAIEAAARYEPRGNWRQDILALVAEVRRLREVERTARWLHELVDRDASLGDPWDLQCLKNHGLVWHQLAKALGVL